MRKVLSIASTILALGLFGLLAVWPVWPDEPGPLPAAQPTARPDLPPTGDDQSDDDDDDDGVLLGAIEGTVVDLSTGRPGAGLKVRLNEVIVTTDSRGHYSLTGLGSGRYRVSLLVEPPAIAAQEPVTVTVAGPHPVQVDLGLYSSPPPIPTPTLEPPQTLPETGADLTVQP